MEEKSNKPAPAAVISGFERKKDMRCCWEEKAYQQNSYETALINLFLEKASSDRITADSTDERRRRWQERLCSTIIYPL